MNDSDMEVDEELPNLSVNIEKAQIERLTKKEMKIQEDPWDNYLYYDSRYIIPIFCH